MFERPVLGLCMLDADSRARAFIRTRYGRFYKCGYILRAVSDVLRMSPQTVSCEVTGDSWHRCFYMQISLRPFLILAGGKVWFGLGRALLLPFGTVVLSTILLGAPRSRCFQLRTMCRSRSL